MSRATKSRRAQKYPAGANAANGFLIIEGLPSGYLPGRVAGEWPGFVADEYETYLLNHNAHFSQERTKPAKPSPYEIDRAWGWVAPCKFMWGKDRDDWQVFMAYARGLPIRNIADIFGNHENTIRKRLDKIFYQIEVEATVLAMLGDAA